MSKGKAQRIPTNQPQEFKFSVKQNLNKPKNAQTGGPIFLFGNAKTKEALVKSKRCLKSPNKMRRMKARQRETNQ